MRHGRLGETVPAGSSLPAGLPTSHRPGAQGVRPFVEFQDKARTDGVFPNVGPFVCQIEFTPHPMIEKIPLPTDSEAAGGVAFPPGGEFRHSLTFIPIECQQGMQVVRHQQGQVNMPLALVLVKLEGIQETVGNVRDGQLVRSP